MAFSSSFAGGLLSCALLLLAASAGLWLCSAYSMAPKADCASCKSAGAAQCHSPERGPQRVATSAAQCHLISIHKHPCTAFHTFASSCSSWRSQSCCSSGL